MTTTILVFLVLQVILKFLSTLLAFLSVKLEGKNPAAAEILLTLSKIVGMFGVGKYSKQEVVPMERIVSNDRQSSR